MILQISCPAAGDKYFNTSATGGVSTCIACSPCAQGLNTLPNCVGGAWGCYNKAAGRTDLIAYPPNAGRQWLLRAQQQGLSVSQYPSAGCVAVWGNPDNIDTGHVAFVYKVDNDGTIYTSESEWKGRTWVNRSYKPPYQYGSKKFLGFIHQPKAQHPVLREGSKGESVRHLQQLLISKGYQRKGEADGDFGKITKGALCCYQLENGLTIDGVCGPKTWAKIE